MTASPPVLHRLPVGKLLLLSFCMMVVITVEVAPVGVLPQMAADFGVHQTHAALLISSYALTVVLASVPAIRLLDGFDRCHILMISMSAFAVSTLFLSATSSVTLAIFARVVGGLGHSIFFGVGMDITHRLCPPHRVVTGMAIFFAGNVIALAFAVPLVAASGTHWRGPFCALGAAAAACVLAARIILPALPSLKTATARTSFFPRPDRGAATICLLGIFWLTGHFLAFTLLRTELSSSGFPDHFVPLLLMVYGLGTLAGTALSGTVVPQRLQPALAVGFLILCGSQLCMVTVLPNVALAIVFAAVWGLGLGVIPTLNSSALLRFSKVPIDLTGSMLNSACNVGISIGSLAAGLTFRHLGHSSPFLFSAAVFFAGALATRALKEPSLSP